MAAGTTDDPYLLTAEDVEDAPVRPFAILKRIGPGLVTASAVVGTGELIATPVLGAENGYLLLWLVILSCVIKIVVQNELGRYSIGTGETGVEALNRLPGPRLRVSWVLWLWLCMYTTTLMTQSTMLAGIAEVMNRVFPSISITVWIWTLTIGTIVLLVAGRYGFIEKISISLVVCFTFVTVGAAFVLMLRPEYFSWGRLSEGFLFHLPQGGLATAAAVFGITGVGSADLINYSYWCIEKGYARYTGQRDETPAWLKRARGWIRVMGADVIFSASVYTFATVAFYLLGAGILHATLTPNDGVEGGCPLGLPCLAWHFGLFAGLGVAIAARYATSDAARRSPQRVLGMVVLGVWMFAAATEIGQGWVDGREPQLIDWVADMAGAVTGLLLGSVLLRWLLEGR